MMKLTAVIVWYNPSELKEPHSCVDNILSYSEELEKVYIIDNSSVNNLCFAQKIPNSEYIPLMNNYGIAYALNRGFEKAINDGYDWIMTMDQDSYWTSVEIKKYISWAYDISKQTNIASIAPRPLFETKSLARMFLDLFFKEKNTSDNDIEFVNRVICSSNIVSTYAWKKVGGFNEKMFIDEVDYEFCYKLRDMQYLIAINNTIVFNHTIGSPQKLTLKHNIHNHNDFRLYYIFRNLMYIISKYPKYAEEYSYKKYLSRLIRKTCIFDLNFLKHREIYQRAKKDYLDLI